MKFIGTLLLCSSFAMAADPKPIYNQAGNDQIDLSGTVLMMRNDIELALDGPSLPPGYMVVKLKVTPKTEQTLRISPDDFMLLSRKDGQRGSALSPHQIAGGGTVLVVKPAVNQPGGDGTTVNGPIWGGVGTRRKSPSKDDEASVHTATSEGDSFLVKVLTEKSLPDKDIKTTVEGLLYFAVDGKLKPKDLSLIYQGPAGKLVIDFN
jgi:hypothetical protein